MGAKVSNRGQFTDHRIKFYTLHLHAMLRLQIEDKESMCGCQAGQISV